MAGTTKIKAKIDKNGVCEVKALASHDMLSYQEAERAKKRQTLLHIWLQKLVEKLYMKYLLVNSYQKTLTSNFHLQVQKLEMILKLLGKI